MIDTEQYLEKLSPDVSLIIKTMAVIIRPIPSSTLQGLRSLLGIKTVDFNSALTTIKSMNYPIVKFNERYGKGILYGIDKEFKVQLVSGIAKQDTEWLDKIASNYIVDFRVSESITIGKAIIKFLKSGERPAFKPMNVVADEYVYSFLQAILLDENYRGIEAAFSGQEIARVYQIELYKRISNLLPLESLDKIYERFTAAISGDKKLLITLSDTHAIIDLLSGRVAKIVKEVSLSSSDGCYVMGTHYLYTGSYAAAARSFEQGLKFERLGADEILPMLPLFNYYYILALIMSDEPAHKKRLNVIYAKKPLSRHLKYAPAQLLLANKLASTYYISEGAEKDSPLIQLLNGAIRYHYSLEDDPKQPSNPSLLLTTPVKSYRLLLLEVMANRSNFADQYASHWAHCGCESVIRRDRVIPLWERLLGNLIVPGGGTKTSCSANKTNRIIYHVVLAPRYSIQPIVQSSKDGGLTWSGGRNLSLKTMSKHGVEGMNDVDNKVANCIDVNSSYYYGDEVSINIDKAFKALIGSPNVFLLSSPTVPVDVVEQAPEITVSVSSKGYKIATNVKSKWDGITLTTETATRVQVMSLNTRQSAIIQALAQLDEVPPEAKETLFTLLKQIGGLFTIHSDLIGESTNINKIDSDSRLVIQLLPIGETIRAEIFVKPLTSAPPYCKVGIGAKSVMGDLQGVKCQAIRELNAEKKNLDTLLPKLEECADQQSDDVLHTYIFAEPESALQLIETLQSYSDIAVVEWPEGVKYKLHQPVAMDALKMSVKSSMQWFNIEGQLHISEDRVLSLQQLIQGVQGAHGRFISIGENEYLAISNTLKRRLAELGKVATQGAKEQLKVPQYAISIFDGINEQGVVLKTDKGFKELQKNIDKAAKVKIDVPSTLKAELRDYQVIGFTWMARLAEWGAGACLADDMGLGKTVQTIAMMLRSADKGATLVVCPASVVPNWERELNRFAPSLNVRTLNSESDRALAVDQAAAYDVVLTTYGLLVTEQELVTAKQWRMVVLDEAHTIKNRETKMSKAAMNLSAHFRLLLTGTPVQNHLGEIWNLFHFTNPGLLGTLEQFTERFITPIVQNSDKGVQKQLKSLISPFLLRRTKSAVLEELPSKTEIVYQIEMSEQQSAYYEILRRSAQTAMIEAQPSDRLKLLAEITRLRLAACNLSLVDPTFQFGSAKMDCFISLVNTLRDSDHSALVFSQFTSHLALVKAELDRLEIPYLYLDGSTPIKQREELVAKFQQGNCMLFLVSLKAGGLGLNLTAADFVIHLDPWWNPAIEDQATDRAHRIGQNRPVTVYRLISKGTIEEKILRLHAGKRDLADALLEGADIAHQLTRDELLELMGARG